MDFLQLRELNYIKVLASIDQLSHCKKLFTKKERASWD